MAKRPPETNPFIQSLSIRGVWKMTTNHRIGEGSVVSQLSVALLDMDDRCAVYSDGLLAWFTGLTTSAKDMFIWVSAHLPYEQDYLEIIDERYCEEMQVGRSTFFTAKAQLINRLLIPRSTRKNTYWVNPSYLFKGSRVKCFREQVREVNENPVKKIEKQQP